MNNTTTKRNLALAAVFMAAILVVGTFATTTTIAITQSAFAYPQKKKVGGGDENSKNGNTITLQKCKQAATQSGFDNTQDQDCKNTICTHAGENATCVQEAAVSTPIPTPVKKTCEQCFTSLLNRSQINVFPSFFQVASIADVCTLLEQGEINEATLRETLFVVRATVTTQNELIACLKAAGIVFTT